MSAETRKPVQLRHNTRVATQPMKTMLLIGSNRRPLVLLGLEAVEDRRLRAVTLWRAVGEMIDWEYSKTFLTQAYRMRGGTWEPLHSQMTEGGDPPTVRLRNRRGSNHENYFDAFCQRVAQLTGSGEVLNADGQMEAEGNAPGAP